MNQNSLNTFYNKIRQYHYQNFEDQPNINNFCLEIKLSLNWSINNMNIYPINSDGGGALLMTKNKSSKEAYFGFIYASNEKLFSKIWSSMSDKANQLNVRHLKGPIQGTTFFPYRFVSKTDGSPFFKGEYFNTIRDHQFIIRQKPDKIITYESAHRSNFDNIIKISKPYYLKSKKEGYVFKRETHIDENLYTELYQLVNKIFCSNWGFQKISLKDFFDYFSSNNDVPSKIMFHTIYKSKRLIGFARCIEENGETLIFKTVGLLPEYQKLGLGNAITYKVHVDAVKYEYKKIIYALIRSESRVNNMPDPDITRFRTYSSYEFLL